MVVFGRPVRQQLERPKPKRFEIDDIVHVNRYHIRSLEETEKIIQEVIHRGYFSEIQRLFGIHYHPDREVGNELLGYFQEHKLYPFTDALNKQEEK